jgi:hypothetical protein
MSSLFFSVSRVKGRGNKLIAGAPGCFTEKVKKFFNERKLTIKYLIVFYIILDHRESSQLPLRRSRLRAGKDNPALRSCKYFRLRYNGFWQKE